MTVVEQRAAKVGSPGDPSGSTSRAGEVDETAPSGAAVSFHVGTPSRWNYLKGCRCTDCRRANADYVREARRRRTRPDRIPLAALVPPGRVRSHVSDLIDQGLSASEIGRQAGLSARTVLNVVQGRHARIQPRIARALLDVLPPREACHDDDDHRPGFQDPLAVLRLRVDPDELAWKARGECRRLDLTREEFDRVFFPTRGGDTTIAKEVCARCPVRMSCLNLAVEYRLDGIWGGTHAAHRDRWLSWARAWAEHR